MSKVIHPKEKEYYDSYLWEKTSYVTFMSRIKRNNTPLEIAILPWKLQNSRERLKEKWKEYRDNDPAWRYYNNYVWDKVWFRYFKEKIRAWMPMEEAIKRERKRADYLKENKYKKSKKVKPITISNHESNFYIEITYSKEEANVIRKVYIEIIEDNEERILSCEPEEMNELVKRSDQLKRELEVFNKWNPQ